MTTTTKQHEHDCDSCEFLGAWQEFDIYVHRHDNARLPSTLIARYGPNADYLSGDIHTAKSSVPALQVAEVMWRKSVERAIDALVNSPVNVGWLSLKGGR